MKELPENNPKPKYEPNQKVETPAGKRIIISHCGWYLHDNIWQPTYYCVPITKKGKPDKRVNRRHMNIWMETDLIPEND